MKMARGAAANSVPSRRVEEQRVRGVGAGDRTVAAREKHSQVDLGEVTPTGPRWQPPVVLPHGLNDFTPHLAGGLASSAGPAG
jgi:hypothetical protein